MDFELQDCVVFNFNNRVLCGKIKETGKIEEVYSRFRNNTRNKKLDRDENDLFLTYAIPFCTCKVHHAKSLGDGHGREPDRKGLAHIVKKDNTVLGFVDRLKKERESFANLEKVVLKFLPDREVYKTAVRKTVERIVQDGIIEKIVLGRKLHLASKHPGEINPLWILKMLLLRNPSRYIFSLPIETGVLQGASPELLIAKRGSEVLSVPLAGSLPISSALSNALCVDADGFVRNLDRCNLYDFKELYSKKNLHEHAFVVKDIVSKLADVAELAEERQPAVLFADTVLHLATKIEGRLIRDRSVFHLAKLLHPTPAVSGWPRHGICNLIHQLEGESRGYFGGVVGWEDLDGNGESVVAIRCAEVSVDEGAPGLLTFAGAGIVKGSVPEKEAVETFAKMQTMLKVVFGDNVKICDGGTRERSV